MSQGRALGVDLFELWHAGEDLVPTVGAQFGHAARPLADARSDGAWFRSCEPGLGRPYGAGEAFGELADTLLGYLRMNERNLQSVGDALVIAANNYAYADDTAVEEFERRKREWNQIGSDVGPT